MTFSGVFHIVKKKINAFFRLLKKNLKTVILCAVIFLLTLTLVFSLFMIKNKNSDIETLIKENKAQIAEITKQLDDAEKQIAEKEKKNDELNTKLQQAEKDKENLQNENKNLRTEISKLKAKKLIEAEKATALQNSPQSVYPPATKVCYLTFDDGPSDNTLSILNTLDRYAAKATFFVSGSHSNLEYVRQIHAKGHVVGLHTNTHNYSQIYRSPEAYFNDLNAISARVESLIGIKSKIIRFPGGSSNVVSKKYCKGIMTTLTRQVKMKGYAYFDWNVDSCDASVNANSAAGIVNHVKKYAANKKSVCLLMHDSSSKKATAQALPAVMNELKKMGFYFDTLKEETYGYHHGISN